MKEAHEILEAARAVARKKTLEERQIDLTFWTKWCTITIAIMAIIQATLAILNYLLLSDR